MIGKFLLGRIVGGETEGPAEIRREASEYHISDFRGLDPWKRRMTIRWVVGTAIAGIACLVAFCLILRGSVESEHATWFDQSSPEVSEALATAEDHANREGAVRVQVGTYVENIDSVDIKDSSFDATVLVWFRWTGSPDLDMANHFSILRGLTNSSAVIRDETVGDTRYQLVRITTTVAKLYDTRRFPLDSHELRIVVESTYRAARVLFVPDYDNSSMNAALSVPGYNVTAIRNGITANVSETSESDPFAIDAPVMSDFVTAIDIDSHGLGLYFKCFIAMYGTTLWVLIMLFVCGHQRIDPLDMLPDALFGTVANIMIGAELLPDALDLGLLEFMNIWGVVTILATTLAVIQVNNIRSDYGNRPDEEYAEFFGRSMFLVVAALAVVGDIAIPLAASMG